MKTKFLLPYRWKKVGIFAAIGFAALLMAVEVFGVDVPFLRFPTDTGNLIDFSNNNFGDEIALIGLIASLLIVAFSKERIEDEWVMLQRLRALQTAVLVNYGVVMAATALIYGTQFLMVLYLNLLTTLLLFVLIFNGKQWLRSRTEKAEAV